MWKCFLWNLLCTILTTYLNFGWKITIFRFTLVCEKSETYYFWLHSLSIDHIGLACLYLLVQLQWKKVIHIITHLIKLNHQFFANFYIGWSKATLKRQKFETVSKNIILTTSYYIEFELLPKNFSSRAVIWVSHICTLVHLMSPSVRQNV